MSPRFNLLAGHPALDFVNTLDDRFRATSVERLCSFDDLVAFEEQSDLLESVDLPLLRRHGGGVSAQQGLQTAVELRETLAAIFYPLASGESVGTDSVLTEQIVFSLSQVSRFRSLVRGAEGHYRWSWEKLVSRPDLVWAPVAWEAAELLTSPELLRVKECGNGSCRWLFLDTSRNRSRRWCDMKVCGNRGKARRFYERRRARG